MRTIKITKELKDFAQNIYTIDFKDRIDSIHQELQAKITDPDFHQVESTLVHLDQQLDTLLTMTPSEMKTFNETFKKSFKGALNVKIRPGTKKTSLKYWLNEKFRYSTFREEMRVKIIHEIGVKSCPYCNAQLTIGFEKLSKKHGKANFQLDHFYPQIDFPYLSISFFNLIPCCGNCNLSKGDGNYELGKDFHLFTENDEYSFFKFEIEKVSKAKFLLSKVPEDLTVQLKGKYKHYDTLTAHHNEKFNIEGIYNSQKDIVEELFQKKEIYTEAFKKDLKDLLGTKWNSTASMDLIILGNYHLEEDIHKRPMAKFTQDIARDVGLI